jgi:hypothetical protein
MRLSGFGREDRFVGSTKRARSAQGEESLDALDGEGHEVGDGGYFALDEGFGIADAGQQTVVAGCGERALADVVFGDEEAGSGGLGSVLGAVGEQGLQPGLDVGADVDDESGADVGVERGVEDLVGAVGGAVLGVELEAGEARGEAGFVAQGGGGVVVGMAALPVGEDHDAGAEAAQDSGDLEAIFLGVLDVAVGEVEGFAMGDAEDGGGVGGFGSALGGGATGSGLSAGEIEDAGAPAEGLLDQKGAAAGLLDVIAMCGDGKDIERTCMGRG